MMIHPFKALENIMKSSTIPFHKVWIAIHGKIMSFFEILKWIFEKLMFAWIAFPFIFIHSDVVEGYVNIDRNPGGFLKEFLLLSLLGVAGFFISRYIIGRVFDAIIGFFDTAQYRHEFTLDYNLRTIEKNNAVIGAKDEIKRKAMVAAQRAAEDSMVDVNSILFDSPIKSSAEEYLSRVLPKTAAAEVSATTTDHPSAYDTTETTPLSERSFTASGLWAVRETSKGGTVILPKEEGLAYFKQMDDEKAGKPTHNGIFRNPEKYTDVASVLINGVLPSGRAPSAVPNPSKVVSLTTFFSGSNSLYRV